MEEIFKILIGVIVLFLGIPIGNLLAKFTKEELNEGQKWFKLLVLLGLIGGLIGLILGDDVVLFTFFFVSIVSSRSLKNKNN